MRNLPATLCLACAVFLFSPTEGWSADFQKGLTASIVGDYATSLREFEPLAEQGIVGAQFNLAQLYRQGLGVPQDYKTAMKWYRLSAEQGNAIAQFYLGEMHRMGGYGVRQNNETAVKWYRLAAEQGYAGAQFNLGIIYYKGRGVPQDYKTAVKWYRLAAVQGSDSNTYKAIAGAQTNLKKIKTELVEKSMNDCLYDEIDNIRDSNTRQIVSIKCRNRLNKRSLDWLIRNTD